MANDDIRTGGSGGTKSLYDALTTEKGLRIDVGSLATVVAGIISTAFGTSMADAIASVFDVWIVEPLNQYGALLGELASWSPVGAVLDQATQQTAAFVEWFGPAAFIVALIVTILTAYAVATGWSLYG